MDYTNSKLTLFKNTFAAGKVGWRSPSNLAIVKYWGKYGVQLPRNPSISFTLTNAHTNTWLEYESEPNRKELDLSFYFEGKENKAFEAKIEKFLQSLLPIFPFLNQLKLTIWSENSFPHSAGIASSASAMSALSLCLCSMEQKMFGNLADEQDFLKKASYISRLGSGSACRSVYPSLAAWGETASIEGSSNLFAVPCESLVHPVFHTFHDDILFISRKEKSVSSRAGHALMEDNTYAEARYQQARNRMWDLMYALESGDIERFGEIAENEALTLHALMMTSHPSYILMTANSLAAIHAVREFRASTKLPLYFSLDAGPNLHLLYPDEAKDKIQPFIKEELALFCEDGAYLEDIVGKGASKL